jgi:hypothetical protein
MLQVLQLPFGPTCSDASHGFQGRLQLSDDEPATLGEIGHRLGLKVLGEVANVARPDTILAWYRKLVARKFDGSKVRRVPGRPRVDRELEQLIVRLAKENRDWGYDRIAGALANLGYEVCDHTFALSPDRFDRTEIHSPRFDCCAFLFYSFYAATFSTVSTHRKHAANRYSITSSARARMEGGRVMPSCLAVLRLTANSNTVGCSIGSSPGDVLRRMLAT